MEFKHSFAIADMCSQIYFFLYLFLISVCENSEGKIIVDNLLDY